MNRPARLIAALAGLGLLGLATVARAQDPTPDRCRPSDIIFLIDDSYSFGDGRAQGRAFGDGIEAFLGTVGEQHRIALVSFGTEAVTLAELAPNTAAARQALGDKVRAMRFREPWTNVYAGIDQAYRWARIDKTRRGVIVLISDGAISMPDPNRPGSVAESDEAKAQQLSLIRGRLPDVVKGGASIYALAYIGKNTDYALMKEIAQGTDGIYEAGDAETLPKVMANVAIEMCKRDQTPAEVKPKKPSVAVPNVMGPGGPAPIASAPVAPTAPVAVGAAGTVGAVGAAGAAGAAGGSAVLWLAVAAGGLGLVGTSVVVARRGRRRRDTAAAAAAAAGPDGGWAEAGVESEAAVAVARERQVARARPARATEDAADPYFTARRGTVSMEAIPEPAVPKRAPTRATSGGAAASPAAEAERARAAAAQAPDPRLLSTAGAPAIAATAAASASTKAKPRGAAPPGKPGWAEDHMVRVIGYTAGGVVIKESDFRRSGEVIMAIGLGAGAILDVPADKGHVRGSFKFTVDPDGTRVVTVHDLPPGGFRDKDTGKALREGDRLTNNLRIEWAKEERGRYLEVLLK